MLRILKIAVYLLTCTLSTLGFSQAEKAYFENFTSENGLSNNRIQCILQDSKGWMWFGTNLGINRFDGYKFYIYKNDPADSTSLIGALVRILFEDSKGNIWAGTENGGLNIYNRDKNIFKRVTFNNGKSLSGNSVNAIVEDSIGNLWLGNDYGLNKYHPATGDLTVYVLYNQVVNQMGSNNILELQFDHAGNLWIGTPKGIDVFNISTTEFYHINQPHDLTNEEIRELFIDDDGKIWIGTYNNGIFIHNPLDKEYQHIIIDPLNERSITVRTIEHDKKGNYWIGTRGGLYQLNIKERKKTLYQNDVRESETLAQNSVLDIICDIKGDIWVGTRGGISYLADNKQIFKHYKALPNDNNYLNDNEIYSFWQDHSNKLWIGTERGGINILNLITGKFQYMMHNPDKSGGLSVNCIKAFTEDQQGNVWIGTYNGGINVYNQETTTFTYYKHDPSDSLSLTNNKVWSIHRDSKSNIWIGTERGLDRYNPKTNSFIHYRHIDNYGPIVYIGEDSDHDLLLCCFSKSMIFRPDSQIVDMIDIQSRFIVEDTKGRHWLASLSNGLVLYDKAAGTIKKYYNEMSGIANNRTYHILIDDKNFLWISTENGLSRFDPEKEEFKNFYILDGLQNNQFHYGAAYKMSGGELVFGGVNGFNIFDPEQIFESDYKSNIVFTDFRIFNKHVPISDDKNAILRKSIFESSQVFIPFKKNVFTFEFASLNYAEVNKTKYLYKLEGFEKEWNEAGSQRTATYTNLNPGKYIFKVRASNNNFLYNETSTSIAVIILPPWWMTWWFRITVTLLIIGSAVGFYLARINQIKQKKAELEKVVAERTKELQKAIYELNETNTLMEEKQQKIEEQSEELKVQKESLAQKSDDLKKLNTELLELNSTKDKFFSIIAHDLRNPLGTTLGFSELMMKRYEKLPEEKKKKYISAIYSSTNHIYILLENLLYWAKSQTKTLNFEPSKFYIIDCIKENIELLQETLFKKAINLKNDITKTPLLFGDKNMISTVIRNLLSNAIKFTPKEGEIILSSETQKKKIIVNVTDTGIGMSKDEARNIFRIDKSTSKKGTEGERGTGLGLIVCNEFVTKNKGKIWVESKIGKGSTFSFSIPIANKKE